MKIFLRTIFFVAVAASLAAAIAVRADAATSSRFHHQHARPVRSFDGVWSVAIYTSYGSCTSYRAAVQIVGGRVESRGGEYSASGAVARNGAISVTVGNSAGAALGSGRLSGSRGAGQWRTEGGECGGVWYAIRRGY